MSYNNDIDSKERAMKFTLITNSGKVYTFYIKALAETYQKAYGGVVFTQQVLVDTETV
jgi:hypothetical protein